MTTDGFLVCQEHGDMYWQQNVGGHTIIESSSVLAIHPDAPRPVTGAEIDCFCGQPLMIAVRPAVKRIAA